MASLIEKKLGQEYNFRQILEIIFVIVAIIFVLFWVYNTGILTKLGIIIPDFGGTNKTVANVPCNFKIALLGPNGMIFLDSSGKPVNSVIESVDALNLKLHSNIVISGNKILVRDQYDVNGNPVTLRDNLIGNINADGFLVLNSQILERVGSIYNDVAKKLPDFYYVQNINGSKIVSDYKICRDSLVPSLSPPGPSVENINYVGALVASGNKIQIFLNLGPGGEVYSGLYFKNNILYAQKNRLGLDFLASDLEIGKRDSNKITVYSPYLKTVDIADNSDFVIGEDN